jgi:signal transduction histidine kinase
MRSISLRGCLIGAVILITIVPALVGFGAWTIVAGNQQHALDQRLAQAASFVRDARPRIGSAPWRTQFLRRLTDLQVFGFVTERTGRGERQLFPPPSMMATYPIGLRRVANPRSPEPAKSYTFHTAEGEIALTLVSAPLDRSARLAWALLAGVLTAILTLALGFWALGRWLTTPLRSLSEDVDRIAGGEPLPTRRRSRIREIENVHQAVTEMNEALGEARRHESDIDHERRFLISAIAHDLRTPLFALRGYLQAHQLGVGESSREDYLRLASAKAEQIDRLVSDLFEFSRLELVSERPEFTELSLSDLAKTSAAAFAQIAAARGTEITIEADENVFVEGNADMLERVIANLLENALRYSKPPGVIRVAVGVTDAREAWLTVSDNGPGVPEQDVPKLFEPLYRGDKARNEAGGGAGLGLSIAKRLIEAHGGNIGVHNMNGAVFTVVLPLCNTDRARPSRDAETVQESNDTMTTPVTP